jgi:hypothetical protein
LEELFNDDNEVTTKEVKEAEEAGGGMLISMKSPICYLKLGMNKTVARCVVDTGAEVSTVSLEFVRTAGLTIQELNKAMFPGGIPSISLANNTSESMVGYCVVDVRLQGVGFIYTKAFFLVTLFEPKSHHILLGMPFLRQVRFAINISASGKTSCRVMSENGLRSAIWRASGTDWSSYSRRGGKEKCRVY